MMRTGEGREIAVWRQQLQRSQVNLLISSQRAVDGLLGFGERGWVEYDQIKLDVLPNLLGEIVEHVCFLCGDRDSVKVSILVYQLHRGAADLHGCYRGSPCFRACDPKRPLI